MPESDETRRVSTSLSVATIDWLHETYPDATSDGEAIRHAISDARKHNRVLEAESTVWVRESIEE